jgi:hypothetical protein
MLTKKLLVIIVIFFTQILGSTYSQAATSYKLNLVVTETEAIDRIARFNGETTKAVCGKKNFTFLNGNFTGQAAKVNTSTRVRVKNESGKLIGTGSLSSILWKTDYASGNLIQGTCSFSTTLTVKSAQFYTIELIGLSSYDFSLTELKASKWKVSIDY